MDAIFHHVAARIAAWSPLRKGVLAFALAATLVEIGLRYGAPRSRAYAAWTSGLEAVGSFWTAILLSVVYFVPLSLVNLAFRLGGKDPLDRALQAEPSFWRRHEPNPLGPEGAARYQF